MARRIWHKEDIRDLKRMYPDHSTAEVADFLCRTLAATYGMAGKLGLSKSEQFLQSSLSGRLTEKSGWSTRFKKDHATQYHSSISGRAERVDPGTS